MGNEKLVDWLILPVLPVLFQILECEKLHIVAEFSFNSKLDLLIDIRFFKIYQLVPGFFEKSNFNWLISSLCFYYRCRFLKILKSQWLQNPKVPAVTFVQEIHESNSVDMKRRILEIQSEKLCNIRWRSKIAECAMEILFTCVTAVGGIILMFKFVLWLLLLTRLLPTAITQIKKKDFNYTLHYFPTSSCFTPSSLLFTQSDIFNFCNLFFYSMAFVNWKKLNKKENDERIAIFKSM